MTRLYELTERFATALRVWERAETPEEEAEALKDVLLVDEEREAKLANCCGYLKSLDADADKIANEIKRLQAKKERVENRSETFTKYLTANLLPNETWSNAVHSIGWRKSEAVVITGDVPEQYVREVVKREPDKTAIKKDLKAGAEIPGAFLEVRNNLQIK